jgi:hypothetical protein
MVTLVPKLSHPRDLRAGFWPQAEPRRVEPKSYSEPVWSWSSFRPLLVDAKSTKDE